MKTEFKLYKNFKPYSAYNCKKQTTKQTVKEKILPLTGSLVGVGAGLLATKKCSGDRTAQELKKVLTMAALSNVGGIIGGSIGAKKDDIKEKCREGAFQFMNISIPMIMVTGALKLCETTKTLNKIPYKIAGSALGMIAGASAAIGITNIGKKEEEQRKYTIKDSVANLDDIVATIAIGFEKLNDIVHADKFLPFIYLYSGMRTGTAKAKEENITTKS